MRLAHGPTGPRKRKASRPATPRPAAPQPRGSPPKATPPRAQQEGERTGTPGAAGDERTFAAEVGRGDDGSERGSSDFAEGEGAADAASNSLESLSDS